MIRPATNTVLRIEISSPEGPRTIMRNEKTGKFIFVAPGMDTLEATLGQAAESAWVVSLTGVLTLWESIRSLELVCENIRKFVVEPLCLGGHATITLSSGLGFTRTTLDGALEALWLAFEAAGASVVTVAEKGQSVETGTVDAKQDLQAPVVEGLASDLGIN